MTASLSVLSKLRLAGEILASYARVRWTLHGSDLPRTVASLRRRRGASAALPLPDPTRDGRRLGFAVVRTLEALPTDSRCLMRSLVLLAMVARRGTDGQLVIAVRPGEEAALAAHAWIEVGGYPLLAPADEDHARLVTL